MGEESGVITVRSCSELGISQLVVYGLSKKVTNAGRERKTNFLPEEKWIIVSVCLGLGECICSTVAWD